MYLEIILYILTKGACQSNKDCTSVKCVKKPAPRVCKKNKQGSLVPCTKQTQRTACKGLGRCIVKPPRKTCKNQKPEKECKNRKDCAGKPCTKPKPKKYCKDTAALCQNRKECGGKPCTTQRSAKVCRNGRDITSQACVKKDDCTLPRGCDGRKCRKVGPCVINKPGGTKNPQDLRCPNGRGKGRGIPKPKCLSTSSFKFCKGTETSCTTRQDCKVKHPGMPCVKRGAKKECSRTGKDCSTNPKNCIPKTDGKCQRTPPLKACRRTTDVCKTRKDCPRGKPCVKAAPKKVCSNSKTDECRTHSHCIPINCKGKKCTISKYQS